MEVAMVKLIAGLAMWLWSAASFATGPLADTCWWQGIQWTGPPHGAQFQGQTIQKMYAPPQQMADAGFDHLVGWITAVTQEPCRRFVLPAKIEIRQYRIIERSAAGRERVAQTIDFQRGETGVLTGELYNRVPNWYTSGKSAEQPHVAGPRDGKYVIDLVPATRRIYHAWTEPRIPATPGAEYFIEVEVRVTGTARLQVGIDYWKGALDYNGWSEGCVASNNCEAFLSEWIGNTWGRFITVRAPGR
jgi:hypothetical protein